MGAYATIFPSYVNLMVLDSNMGEHVLHRKQLFTTISIYLMFILLKDSGADIERFAEDSARSRNHRFEYFISACDRNPNLCPVSNMRHCNTAMNDLVRANGKDLSDFLKPLAVAEPGAEPRPGDLQTSEMIIMLLILNREY